MKDMQKYEKTVRKIKSITAFQENYYSNLLLKLSHSAVDIANPRNWRIYLSQMQMYRGILGRLSYELGILNVQYNDTHSTFEELFNIASLPGLNAGQCEAPFLEAGAKGFSVPAMSVFHSELLSEEERALKIEVGRKLFGSKKEDKKETIRKQPSKRMPLNDIRTTENSMNIVNIKSAPLKVTMGFRV